MEAPYKQRCFHIFLSFRFATKSIENRLVRDRISPTANEA
jgi:hypothetical protein